LRKNGRKAGLTQVRLASAFAVFPIRLQSSVHGAKTRLRVNSAGRKAVNRHLRRLFRAFRRSKSWTVLRLGIGLLAQTACRGKKDEQLLGSAPAH
jgi:hypothetical protein